MIVGTKFKLKLKFSKFARKGNFTLHKQFWILGQNLPQKRIFGQKWKVSITIEFWIFELAWLANFTLNKQFPQKGNFTLHKQFWIFA